MALNLAQFIRTAPNGIKRLKRVFMHLVYDETMVLAQTKKPYRDYWNYK